MDVPCQIFVHRAELLLREDDDPDALGATVTVALCGASAHEPPCHWPHHNALTTAGGLAHLRTVFVATASDEHEVRARIDAALGASWAVRESAADALREEEQQLGQRLSRS